MFIAFEGPDKAGKSTSALELDAAQQPTYNITKAEHAKNVEYRKDQTPSQLMLPTAYDRIDWLTHMVYRLAMPDRDWNDDRPRTVFAMPETHLVLKMHHPDTVALIEDELYAAGRLVPVNELYFHQITFLADVNMIRNYALFKSVSIMEVINNPQTGEFSQRLVYHDNAQYSGRYIDMLALAVTTNQDLLEFLSEQDARIG